MNKANFTRMISTFAKVYEKALDPETLSIYFGMFREIPDEQTNKIIRNCLKKCKYFPRPADVFEQYDDTVQEYIVKQEPRLTPKQMETNRKGFRELNKILSGIKDMPETKGG